MGCEKHVTRAMKVKRFDEPLAGCSLAFRRAHDPLVLVVGLGFAKPREWFALEYAKTGLSPRGWELWEVGHPLSELTYYKKNNVGRPWS